MDIELLTKNWWAIALRSAYARSSSASAPRARPRSPQDRCRIAAMTVS